MGGAIDEWRLINQFREGLEHGLSADTPLQSWWEYGVEQTMYREGLYPQISPPASFPFREAQPTRDFQHLGYRTDYAAGTRVDPIGAPAPRSPTYPALPVAATPVPSSRRVAPEYGRGAPSTDFGPGSSKKASPEEPSTTVSKGDFYIYHKGRSL